MNYKFYKSDSKETGILLRYFWKIQSERESSKIINEVMEPDDFLNALHEMSLMERYEFDELYSNSMIVNNELYLHDNSVAKKIIRP